MIPGRKALGARRRFGTGGYFRRCRAMTSDFTHVPVHEATVPHRRDDTNCNRLRGDPDPVGDRVVDHRDFS